MKNNTPLSLYIHLPWCIQKCPYCDFNSHAIKNSSFPEDLYTKALLDELNTVLKLIKEREICSIFFGGGTPSIFSCRSIAKILEHINANIGITHQTEITLEANPGTVDANNFKGFKAAGINRLSIGIQSFQDQKLKILGRIHNQSQALKAINIAKLAGFNNFNLDLMHGLPTQSTTDADFDLRLALDSNPTHISWYQLSIEPNTLFAHTKPILPNEETLFAIQTSGENILIENNFNNYEVSAWSTKNNQCQHNLNYWEFGDYLGLGAGAHSKITCDNKIIRRAQVKHPSDYLNPDKRNKTPWNKVLTKDLPFEFMLNALRLTNGTTVKLYEERTGLNINTIKKLLSNAKTKKLIIDDKKTICATPLGKRFLNDLTELFLHEP